MAIDARLLLSDGTNTYAFDLGGAVVPEARPTYKDRGDGALELAELEERWVVSGAAILGATPTATWAALDTFLAHIEDRTGDPIDRASLQRSDGAGGWVTVRTLGDGNNQQEFRVEALGWGGPDPRLGGAVQRLALPVDMTLSARRLFADGNGIAGWEQRVSVTAGRDGLKIVEWQTELEVLNGAATTALATAQTHAVIPIANYGATYVWDTNSDDGFDYEFPNADEANSRTPTRIICTSRIRQKGITIGTPSAGASIGDLVKSVETIKEGLRTTTITRVTAEGPGALDAVLSRAPSAPLAYSRSVDTRSERRAEGEWHKITQDVIRWRIEAIVSGGHQDVILDETAGNEDPEEVRGVYRPGRVQVRVIVQAVGRRPTLTEMAFPAKLGAPWIFVPNESPEATIPHLVEIGTAREYDIYQREANLVYIAKRLDSDAWSALLKLRNEDLAGVDTYLFEVGGAA